MQFDVNKTITQNFVDWSKELRKEAREKVKNKPSDGSREDYLDASYMVQRFFADGGVQAEVHAGNDNVFSVMFPHVKKADTEIYFRYNTKSDNTVNNWHRSRYICSIYPLSRENADILLEDFFEKKRVEAAEAYLKHVNKKMDEFKVFHDFMETYHIPLGVYKKIVGTFHLTEVNTMPPEVLAVYFPEEAV